MTRLTLFIAALALLGAWYTIVKGRKSLANTTLLGASNWVVLVALAWSFTFACDQGLGLVSGPFADHLWYGTAILSLCPAIAVLGARRPGNRVWTLFILLPMLCVLGWPMGALALQVSELRGLQLETPQLAAYGLVLIMGFGNYCGTRNTLAALICGMVLFATVLSISSVTPSWLADRKFTRFWSTICISMTVCMMSVRQPIHRVHPFDRVWFDFFDDFGIVWGRRIQDRINHLATRERLPVRLELDGFVFTESSMHQVQSTSGNDLTQTEARVEHFLRWLLRRFVDPIWIDQRLNHSAKEIEPQPMSVDS